VTARILLIDDHVAIRRGLQHMLSAEYTSAVFGSVGTADKALQEADSATWDLAILDLNLQNASGLDLIRSLKERQPRMAVLIYSMHSEAQFGIRALKAGADGYATKDSPPEEVISAVHRLLGGGRYISAALAEQLARNVVVKAPDHLHQLLSNRELLVLQKMASGKTVSQIADELSVSVKTVSTYRSRILEKLNMKTTSDLLRYAIENRVSE
jgi:two-component system invasion response regulator UvrY